MSGKSYVLKFLLLENEWADLYLKNPTKLSFDNPVYLGSRI